MKVELVIFIIYENALIKMLVVIISVTMTTTKAIIIATTSMTGRPPTRIMMKLLTKMITRIRGTRFVDCGLGLSFECSWSLFKLRA